MQTHILKTHWGIYAFISPTLLLGLFLLFDKVYAAAFALIGLFVALAFFANNIQARLTETTLVCRSKYRRETVIPYTEIKKIELRMGANIDTKIKGSSGTLRLVVFGTFEGSAQGMNLTLFDHKDIYVFIRKLNNNVKDLEVDENISEIVSGDEKKITSKSIKETAKHVLKNMN